MGTYLILGDKITAYWDKGHLILDNGFLEGCKGHSQHQIPICVRALTN